MSKKQKIQLARYIANLDGVDQCKIINATDDELPHVLEELGIALPSTNWFLVAFKIIFYAAGLILAGIGTTATAQTIL